MKLIQLLEQLEWLFENRKIELIAKKQGQKIMKAHGRDRTHDQRLIDSIFGMTPIVHRGGAKGGDELVQDSAKKIIEFFQTKIHKKYVQWIANRYMNREFQLEDWKTIKDNLKDFDRIKNKLSVKDINQYDSMVALDNAIDSLKDKDVRSNKQKDKEERAQLFKDKEAILFYKDSDIKIEIPKTEEAACVLGKGTRWCTSARNHNQFANYNREGDLYIITTKDGKKFQFHLHTKQFMDEADHEIKMTEVLEEYPSILKAIPKLVDSLSMFDRANINDMSQNEVEGMIKEWIDDGLHQIDMHDDTTVVIESYQDLDKFFRQYDFMELSSMLYYIDDPSTLEEEMDTDKARMDISKYLNQSIIDLIHDRLLDQPQHELFDINTNDKVFNALNNYTTLSRQILNEIVENMTEESAEAMEKYLKDGMEGEGFDHGVMGFLFDTERSHSSGYLLVTDEARNFYDSTYSMSMELYELATNLTETGWDDISDDEFEHEMRRFFGEEFDHNPDLKSPSDFYHTQNMDNLENRIERVMKEWKGL